MQVLERERNPQADFELFGVDISQELKRRSALIVEFGQLGVEIDDFEHQRMEAAHEREFVDDIPYSTAQIYYKDLYTLPHEHPLFRMNIDPEERGGLTKLGFEELRARVRETREALKTNGRKNEVVIWYSPSGPAGEGRFEKIYYDAGRIYLSIVQPDDFTVSFDIKVDENIFPISSFLNQNHTQPFRTGITLEEFSDKVKKEWADKQIYIRQRFTDPRPYTVGDILTGIEAEFFSPEFADQMAKILDFQNRLANSTYKGYNGPAADYLARRNGYLDPIREAIRRDGFVILYGCSATGVRTESDLSGLSFNSKSIFDTSFRIVGLTAEEAKKDPNLCKCGNPSAAHFHCPGENGSCNLPIIVGEGTTSCSQCGMDKIC